MTPSAVRTTLSRYLAPSLTPAASLLLAQGLSLRENMELLGQSQIALTANLYTHLQPAMRKEAAAQMDKGLVFNG